MDNKRVKKVLQTFSNMHKDHLNGRVKKQRQGPGERKASPELLSQKVEEKGYGGYLEKS